MLGSVQCNDGLSYIAIHGIALRLLQFLIYKSGLSYISFLNRLLSVAPGVATSADESVEVKDRELARG